MKMRDLFHSSGTHRICPFIALYEREEGKNGGSD